MALSGAITAQCPSPGASPGRGRLFSVQAYCHPFLARTTHSMSQVLQGVGDYKESVKHAKSSQRCSRYPSAVSVREGRPVKSRFWKRSCPRLTPNHSGKHCPTAVGGAKAGFLKTRLRREDDCRSENKRLSFRSK